MKFLIFFSSSRTLNVIEKRKLCKLSMFLADEVRGGGEAGPFFLIGRLFCFNEMISNLGGSWLVALPYAVACAPMQSACSIYLLDKFGDSFP